MEPIVPPLNYKSHHKKTHGQRLLNSEIDERVVIKCDKSIKKVNGLLTFGEENDYPVIIEKLINGSNTAKSVANIYSKFLTGSGFEANINNIVIGIDSRGKEITVLNLLRQISQSVSYHNGFYIYCNMTYGLDGSATIKNVHIKPFKDCRFNIPDDTKFSAKILTHENWAGKKVKPGNIKEFNVFNLKKEVINAQIKEGKLPGQIYFQFFDDQYYYPLSNFDPIYLDLDTEAQISLYKNRQIRDGFFNKVVFRSNPDGTEEEKREYAQEMIKKLGPNGDSVIFIEDDFNENGEISDSSAFKIDVIENKVDADLFINWEKSLSNNIRKIGGKGVPAILIDYEEGKLSTTSGESIIQATNYYNAITKDDRALISNSFKEIFSNFDNPILSLNTNWNIKPLNLIENVVNSQPGNPAIA